MGFFDWLFRKGKKAEATPPLAHQQHATPDMPPADLAGLSVAISSVGGGVGQGTPDPGVAANLETLMREAEGLPIGSVRGHAVAHLKVDYLRGRYFLNGKIATLEELRTEFSRLGRIGGAVFYYKANPTDGMPPEAETALAAICEARLPVTFASRDYDPAVRVAEYFLPDGVS